MRNDCSLANRLNMTKTNLPKISIVTPSYNQGQYIEQTIQSVLDQNYPNLEYIIIDGGSTDNTVEIIRKYQPYINYWVSEADRGQSHAINKGLAICTGEVFNWLNSDDYYEPGVLHKVGYAFQEKDIDVFAGRYRPTSKTVVMNSEGAAIYQDLLKTIAWSRMDQAGTFFSMEAIRVMGGVDESLHYVMDIEWWIRYLWLFGQHKIFKTDEIIAIFRLHEESKSVSQQPRFKKEIDSIFYTLAKNYGIQQYADFLFTHFEVREISGLSKLPLKPTPEIKSILNYYITYIFLAAYAQNDYQSSRNASKMMDLSLLSSADREEVEKVLFRLKHLPLPIKKIYNRIFRS